LKFYAYDLVNYLLAC